MAGNKERDLDRIKEMLDAYFNNPDLPEGVVTSMRRWIGRWFANARPDDQKFDAMEEIFDEMVEYDRNPDQERIKAGMEKLRSRLDLPGPGEPGYKAMDKNIPLYVTAAGKDLRQRRRDRAKVKKNMESQLGQLLGPAPSPTRRLTPARVAAVAAVVALLAGGAWFFTHDTRGGEPQMAMVMMSVPDTLGAQGRTELPDGTDIWIRPGTTIGIQEDFAAGDKRRLMLAGGEIYLSVARDSVRQFVVETENLTVTVIGTRFDVQAQPGRHQTVVTLYEGQVMADGIANDGGTTQIMMRPGQRLTYDHASGKYRIDQVVALLPDWVAERLNFQHTTLDEIFRRIEWYYGIRIHDSLANHNVYSFRLNGEEDLETTMALVEHITLDFNYRIEGDTVTVMKQTN